MSPWRCVDISLASLQSYTAAVHGAEQKLCLQRRCYCGLVVFSSCVQQDEPENLLGFLFFFVFFFTRTVLLK